MRENLSSEIRNFLYDSSKGLDTRSTIQPFSFFSYNFVAFNNLLSLSVQPLDSPLAEKNV